jgi:hypothetical protein
MFNPDENLSAEMIREWMGIFNNIKSVAKYAGEIPFLMVFSLIQQGSDSAFLPPVLSLTSMWLRFPILNITAFAFQMGYDRPSKGEVIIR